MSCNGGYGRSLRANEARTYFSGQGWSILTENYLLCFSSILTPGYMRNQLNGQNQRGKNKGPLQETGLYTRPSQTTINRLTDAAGQRLALLGASS